MRILLVAYRFPPQSGGGVIRPLKFAKYLWKLGHRVTVLTAGPPAGAIQDSSLLRDLPAEVRVVSVREKTVLPPSPKSRQNGVGPWGRLTDRTRVGLRWLVYQGMVPDEHSGFIGPAAAAADHPDVREADVVLATGGPWSCFVAGDRIARRLGRPLVLDYRDPWTTMFAGTTRPFGILAQRRNPHLERDLVTRADAIVSVMKPFPHMLEEQLQLSGIAARCHWIPNGFDPDDFAGIKPDLSDRFTITYAGSLYGTRSLRPVVRALEDLVRAQRIPLERLRLSILGPPAARVRPELAQSPVLGQIETPGYVPHGQTLARLQGSDLNLLVDILYDGPNIHVPGKLYEYLRAGRAILAISPPGQTDALIREAEGGWVVPPGDQDGLREALATAYEAWAAGRPLPKPRADVTERFSRSRLAVRLAEVLQSCIARAGESRKSA